MSARPRSGLTVGSLRGVPLGSTASTAASEVSARVPAEPRGRGKLALALALAPARRRGCCGTGCVGCPYGDWLRRARALALGAPACEKGDGSSWPEAHERRSQ